MPCLAKVGGIEELLGASDEVCTIWRIFVMVEGENMFIGK